MLGSQGHPQRLRAHYHKPHGSRQLFACYAIGADRLGGRVEPAKGWRPTRRALQSIRARLDDDQPIYVILNNLNHHKNAVVRQWCAEAGRHRRPTEVPVRDPILS